MIDKLNICSHRDYLENFLKRRYPNARNSDIEDAVQNALINAIRKQDQWERNCSLKTWLCTIANNMYVNTFRGLRGKKETIISKNEMNFENSKFCYFSLLIQFTLSRYSYQME